MNAQAEIQALFHVDTGKEGFCIVKQGEVYDGTMNSKGEFIFHVCDKGGRICQAKINVSSPLVKIRMYNANHTQEA